MQRSLLFLLLFTVLVTLAPALALPAPTAADEPAPAPETQQQEGILPSRSAGSITLLDDADGELLTLDMRSYLIGALLSEMPLSFHDEALRAQVVACHSFARYSERFYAANPPDELKGAAFRVNTAAGEGFLTEEAAKLRFGSGFYLCMEKAAEIVDSVLPQLLLFEDAPAACCYHAISPGRTEASENVFQNPLPYLVSVPSEADREAEGFRSERALTLAEFCDVLSRAEPDFSPAGEPESWLQETRLSPSGTVLQLTLCGVPFTGTRLRELFSLRSAAFTLTLSQEGARFDVCGYGHGVGMSQTGADAMAKNGATYREILAHYYPGTRLGTLEGA